MRKIAYTRQALDDLKRLDKKLSKRITSKVAFFAEQKELLPFSKVLTGHPGVLRFRVGDYRILFREDSSGILQVLLVLRVRHRKDVYDL
jgi:mRNA interferase RelE/StbE